MAHIYKGIFLSHKKKRNWVICSEVDGVRVCHTEWSKSEREKQIHETKADRVETSTPPSHQLIEIQTENEQGYICEL